MRLLVLISFLCSFQLHADIFSFWPFRGSSTQPSAGDNASDILEPQKLWTEKVVINGKNMEMGVALVDRKLRDALRLLRMKYPDAPFAANSNSVLFEVTLPNGLRRRIYLVGFAGKDTIVQFTMDVPRDLPAKIPWPAELPLPPAATPVTVMRFPARKSVYGTFRSPYQEKQVLSDVTRALRADGWESAAGETDSATASGDVFLRKDGSEMMILGTLPGSKSASTRGTLYFRRLK